MKTLTSALEELRKISKSWKNTDEVLKTLYEVKRYFRENVFLTDELFDIYDDVVMSIGLIEMEEYSGEFFDGRIFSDVFIKSGLKDKLIMQTMCS